MSNLQRITLARISAISQLAIMIFALIAYDFGGIVSWTFSVPVPEYTAYDRTITDWFYFIGMGLCWAIVGIANYILIINFFNDFLWNKRIAATFLGLTCIPLVTNLIEDPTVSSETSIVVLMLAVLYPFLIHKKNPSYL